MLSLIVTAARALAALVSIAVPLVLVRVFDQTVYGQYKELFLIAGTAVPLLTLGVPTSVYYFAPRRPAQAQRLLLQSVLVLAGLGIGGAVVLLSLGAALQRFFHAPLATYIPWVAVLVALSVPASLLPVAPMVDRRSRLVALLLAGFGCVQAIALILGALWGRDLSLLLAAACVGMALQAAALVAYLVWRGRAGAAPAVPGALREQLAYALPFAAAALLGLFRDRLHAFYVGATMTAAQFAVYAVGLIELPIVDLLTQTVGEVVVLENSAHFSTGRLAEARATWERASVALATILLPLFAVAEVFAPEAITVLFGAGYAGAVSVFRINLLLVPLAILLASPLLRATADLRVMLAADVASLVVAMAALVPMVRMFGPAGAVGSLVAGFATFSAIASRRNAARLGLRFATFLPWRQLGGLLVAAGGCAGLARLVVDTVSPPWRLGLGPALAIALYGAVLWWTGLVPAADRIWVRALLRRIGAIAHDE
jgi:O-antigen/teichoic acid export membrane protein